MNQYDRIISVQSSLYNKYSSSQTYYYTKKIQDISEERRTYYNIVYEDVQGYIEIDEFLKRFYPTPEHSRKMNTFKEYYLYHEDSPRLHQKNVDIIYEKWQDKRRDVIYKKLKLLYDESYSQSISSNSLELPPISNFLLNISQYNPYSKKYYLRVQARKQKELQRKKQQEKLRSKIQLSKLNHGLSAMLNDMSNISSISKINKESKQLPIKKSPIKLTFKKNKEKPLHQIKGKKIKPTIPESKLSPKNNMKEFDSLKAKSLFALSSFNSRQLQINPRLKESLSPEKNEKLKKYQSEKQEKIKKYQSKSTQKLIVKSQSKKLKVKQSSLKQLPNPSVFSDWKIHGSHDIRFSQKLRNSGSTVLQKKIDFKIRQTNPKK